jgi:hypothetical protein
MTARDHTSSSGSAPGSPDAVLAAAREAHRAEHAAAAAKLAAALEWATMHEPTDDRGGVAYRWEAGAAVPLAGDGASEITEFAVAEFAAAGGLTTDAGRSLIGHALELAHRLPRLWEQVQGGRVPTWRARRVADATTALSKPATHYVDRQVAAVAGRVSLPALDRLVQEARIRYDAAERPDPTDPCPVGPESRRVRIMTDQVSFDGTVPVAAELDLADALDLDRALAVAAASSGWLAPPTPLMPAGRSRSARCRAPNSLSPSNSPPTTRPAPPRRPVGHREGRPGRSRCTSTSPTSPSGAARAGWGGARTLGPRSRWRRSGPGAATPAPP